MAEEAGAGAESLTFDPTYAVRMVSDIVQNPWVAREIVACVITGLTARGFSELRLGELAGLIVDELRRWLDEKRSERAEMLFRAGIEAGRIQFRLRADVKLNWQMPVETETSQPTGARQLLNRNGGPLERSVFAPLYEADFSSQDERDVAVYLDGEGALRWWHRNVARSQYSLQGWRREKIYPDFIFAVSRDDGFTRIAVVEMKGQHLAGNDDTEYKRSVLRVLSDHFDWDDTVPVGTLQLADSHREVVECELVLMNEWRTKLPNLLSTNR